MSNPFTEQQLQGFHAALKAWYREHGRHHLPWRQTADPYPIWVSEVMLQQTQVKTVLERYYFPFLQRFPTISALAAADSQEVLKYWEGLGYYNRARYLHQAAQQCMSQHQGHLPESIDALHALPGIGRNTAHAIAAFAYHQPVAILEANVKRIVARIFALETPTEKALWEASHQLLDTENPFDYNQAMMDIGATLCTPEAPQCPLCPANSICRGQTNPTAYPQKKAKKQLPTRHLSIVLFRDLNDRYYISPRESRFLHGLWAFLETDYTRDTLTFQGKDYPLTAMQPLGEIRHTYSHFHLIAQAYIQPIDSRFNDPHWKNAAEIAALPLSRTEQKILRLLSARPTL